jgi:ATP-dependent DNA ligase
MKISIFSRNLENMTEAYPDIVHLLNEYAVENPHLKEFILDSEIVAYDLKT